MHASLGGPSADPDDDPTIFNGFEESQNQNSQV